MDLNDYQRQTEKTAIYPGRGNLQGLAYTALGLTGEAGEVANKVKKLIRDHYGETMTLAQKTAVARELGDVLWYVAQTCTELGVALDDIAYANLAKLASRAERGTLQGDGDQR